jgi:SPASM domain peptide maturase of grasp-with-spasm system
MFPEPAERPGEVFALFACCVPVRGARRSVVCDLQRQSFRFIPNGLYEILTERRGKTVAEIKQAYDHEYDEEIDEYFDFLEREEFGFWCREGDAESFPRLDLGWEAPERITHAIVDVDERSDHDFAKILAELDDLGCKALELRFFRACGLGELRAILAAARYGRLRSIELLLGYGEELSAKALAELARDFPRVSGITVHSAPPAIAASGAVGPRQAELGRQGVEIEYIPQVIDSHRCCGQIHPAYFVTNLEAFSEAQKHNSCLNRKISIDARGEIKNCPSLPRSFGNAREASLHSALAQRDFTALWSINKDQIAVCKDCEFRYICTDCRAYLSDPSDLYAKPSKCTYDPYTAEWRDAEGRPALAAEPPRAASPVLPGAAGETTKGETQ